MAKIRRKGRSKAIQKRMLAFNMFTELDEEQNRRYSYAEISKELNISLNTLYTWNKRYRWQYIFDKARKRALARAGNSGKMRSLLTKYLVEEGKLLERKKDKEKAKKHLIEALQQERLVEVFKNLPDVLYEMRAYNHKMFTVLMREPKKGRLTAREREVYHRAWKDSLDSLLDLIGHKTLRELASNKVAMALPEDSSPVNIHIDNSNSLGLGNVVLGTEAHELIMKTMLGGLPINGPDNYIGATEEGATGIEEAILAQPEGADT